MRSIVRAVAVAATVAALAGCSSNDDKPTKPASSTAAGIPSPDSGQTAVLLTKLADVAPALNDQRSISRARNVCSDIKAGASDAEVASMAKARFSDDTLKLTDAQAAAIVAAVKASFCS